MNEYVARNAVLALSLLVGAACVAGETPARDGLDIGLKARGEATAADAGLPAYPGAKPYKDADQSSSAANIAVSTSLFGLKVVALNLETPDEPKRVAAFYRRALSKYGNVLDCSNAADNARRSDARDDDSNELICDSNDPGANSIVYKVGQEDDQRIVAIKPHGSGTRFSLVHVDTRGRSNR
jgi:hypothetical protein